LPMPSPGMVAIEYVFMNCLRGWMGQALRKL
jgi:hypothetical protein